MFFTLTPNEINSSTFVRGSGGSKPPLGPGISGPLRPAVR